MASPRRFAWFALSCAGLFSSLALAPACSPPPPPDLNFDPKAVFGDLAKGSSRPMVVDWAADDRAALETRATRGAVLVRFTEHGIEPLWDCAVPNSGKYEYTGVSPKRDHIDAKSDAELAANFPMGFARLKTMMKTGQSLSADVRMIGVAELNRLSVRRSELGSDCQRATHFVKELTIGGFQFGASAARDLGVQAGVANYGGEAAYAGVTNRLTEEGDFKICEGADPESRTAPGRCKGILRIRLVPIDQDASQVTQPQCGIGMRWDGSGCVQVQDLRGQQVGTAPQPAYECDKKNVTECVSQCRRGNSASCTFAAQGMMAAKSGSLEDLKTLFLQSCKGKHWEGCSALGDILTYENQDVEAAKLHGAACLGGFSGACTNYGVAVYFGRGGTKQDRGLAYKLWERACRLGDFVACSNAGVIVRKGEGGVPRNEVKARQMYETSCTNNDPGGCSNLAGMYENGIGGPKDKNKAFALFKLACDRGNAASCVDVGLLLEESNPGDRSRVQQALQYYEKSCDMQSAGDGCASFAETKEISGQYYTDEQMERRSCEGSTQSELGCFNAAFVYASDKSGFKNQAKMVEFAKRACKSKGAQKKVCANFR